MRIRTITTYLVSATVAWFAMALLAVMVLFSVSQLMRIAPVFAGADIDFGIFMSSMGLLLLPVLGWALLPALLFGLFFAAGGLAERGELLGLLALGISVRDRLKGGCLLIVVITAASIAIGWVGAPWGVTRLSRLASDICRQAMVNGVSPREMVTLAPGVTFYAEASDGRGAYETVFAAMTRAGKQQEIVAEKACFQYGNGAIGVRFEKGHLFLGHGNGEMVTSFSSFDIRMPVQQTIAQRLDFVPAHLGADAKRLMGPPPPGVAESVWQYTFWRRIAASLSCLVLSLVGMGWAFTTLWRTRGEATLAGVLLFAVYHLLARGTESMMLTGYLSPPAAALLPVVLAPMYVWVHQKAEFLRRIFVRQ